MRPLLLIGALGLLVACAGTPQRVDESPPSVTYRYTGDSLAQVNARAEEDCARYGLEARLRDVVRQPGDNLAVYDCI